MATKWQRGVTPHELGPEYHPALSAQMGRGAFSPIALSICLAFAHLFLIWRSPFVSLSFARLSRIPYP
jgi:hypothetical protein